MKPVRKLTISGMMTGLCLALLLLGAAVPHMAVSFAAMAGLVPALVVLTCGNWWALGVYAAASALSFLLLPGRAPGAMFLCLFGHYPIWKSLIERRFDKRLIRAAIKLAGFACCLFVLYAAFRSLLFDPVSPVLFYSESVWMMAGAFVLALIVLFLYDYAFTILIGYVRARLLPRIQKRS